MKREFQIKCPAKINLTLDVINRRNDGYHNLSMIMQTVNLFDNLSISVEETSADPGVKLYTQSQQIPDDESNLVWKAAKLFFEKANISASARIHLEKNIPVGAGLGGGSSDAAGTLMGLNSLFGHPLSLDYMSALAKSLGADIPFFLHGGCMLAEGIGNKLTPLPPLENIFIVLAKPKISISTAHVYKALILDNSICHPDIKSAVNALYNHDIDTLSKVAGNVLESVTVREYPIIEDYKSIMRDFGAAYSLMSGSGSCVFGIFKNKQSAEQALEKFLSITPTAYMV